MVQNNLCKLDHEDSTILTLPILKIHTQYHARNLGSILSLAPQADDIATTFTEGPSIIVSPLLVGQNCVYVVPILHSLPPHLNHLLLGTGRKDRVDIVDGRECYLSRTQTLGALGHMGANKGCIKFI